MLTPQQIRSFDSDGFLLIEDMFSAAEVEVLASHALEGERAQSNIADMPDAEGRSSKLALWTDVRQDVWGAVTTSPRIVNRMRGLLRDDIYHWHSKVMLKEPRSGGAWEWHQDYGYWYHNGCLYPNLCS